MKRRPSRRRSFVEPYNRKCNLGRSHAIRRYCNLFHIRDGITESREFNDPRQTAASRRGHGRQRKNMASVHPSRRFLGMCAPGRKGIG